MVKLRYENRVYDVSDADSLEFIEFCGQVDAGSKKALVLKLESTEVVD